MVEAGEAQAHGKLPDVRQWNRLRSLEKATVLRMRSSARANRDLRFINIILFTY